MTCAEPLALDARPRRAQHRRADVDAGHQHVAGQQRQFEPRADAHDENLSPRTCGVSRRARRRGPARMEGQIEDEVVNRRPAAVGGFGRMPRIRLRRVDRIHRRTLQASRGSLVPRPYGAKRIIP